MKSVSRDALAVAALAVFLFFAATNLQAGWMYAIDALLVGILAAAWASARWSVRGLVIRRTMSPEVHEGDAVRVQLELQTRRVPRVFLEITDQASGLAGHQMRVPVVWPGRPVVLTYEAMPARRGLFAGGVTTVVSSGLAGWFRAARVVDVTSALTVLPRIWRLGRFRVPARSHDEYSAPRPARTGLEVSGVRHYREGDSLRHVHWRSTARRGRLVVREYEQDTDEPALLLLDARSPGGVTADAVETFEDLVRAAASVADALSTNGRAVRVAASINGTPEHAGPSRRAVLHWLAAIDEDGAVPPSRVYEAVCAPGTPVVVFTADPDSVAYFEARGIPHAAVIAREGDSLRAQLESP